MRLLFTTLFLTAFVLVSFPLARPASAQGDWEVKRDPFNARVVARYKRILERNPADKAALRKLMRLYKRHRSVDRLIREYEAALTKRRNRFAAAVILGHLYLAQGDRERALSYYKRGAEQRPNNAAVQLALAELYRQNGQIQAASAAYKGALASSSNRTVEVQALRALATITLGQGNIDGALAFYQRYFALAPKDVQARIDLGDALSQNGRPRQAIEVLRGAESRLGSDPARQVEVIARIGAAHEAAGQEDEAVRVYRQALGKIGRTYYLRKELTARIVDIYRRRQSLSSLVAQYEQQWAKRKRGHFEWDVLARLYEETGNQEQAIAAYRMATKKAPYELDTQRRLIALLENAGREDEALAQYEVVIRVAPGEPRFQLDLAERYWRRGKEKPALALLAKVEQRFATDGGVHAAIADLYTRWGKVDQALKTYIRLTRIEPGDINHLINLGEQYFQRDNKKQAVAVWKKIISRKTAANYARLGEVYAEHDMLEEALSIYDKAIRLEPKQPAHYKGRAGVYERRREFPRAVDDWQTVLALTANTNANKPARREARRRVVSLLKRARGRHLSTRKRRWRDQFRATPPDIESGYFLVEAELREQRYSHARRTLERLLAINGDDIEAMEQLVKVYKREQKYDQAVRLLVRLAELSPNRQRDYFNQIAEIKTADRKDEEAIEYARKALAQSPNDPVAYLRLAERYAEMQRFAESIAAYQKTIELDPRNFDAYFALAQLYTHSNAPEKAAALYRQILRRATDDQVLGKAGREAIDLEEMTQSLGQLERIVAPLAFTFGHKPIYRRILVELYFRYVPGLVRVWRKGDTGDSAAARAELDRLGTHGLKPLLEALSDESDVNQQRIAVAVLGYLGNKGAAAPLVRLAIQANTPVRQTRRRAGALTPMLDWAVRVDALVAAGRLGDERIIESLNKLVKHKDRSMREAALFGLGRTRDRRALPALTAALSSNSASEQTLACLGLAQIDDQQVSTHLRAVVANRRHSDLARAACAFAMGYIPDHADVDALIAVLDDGNGELQRLAAWALGRRGDRRAISALLREYFSRDDAVRHSVHWALAAIVVGSKEAPTSGEQYAIDLGDYPMRSGHYDPKASLGALPGDLSTTRLPARLIVGHESDLVLGLRDALGRHRDLLVRVLGDLNQADDHLTLGPLTAGLATASGRDQARIRRVLDRIGKALFMQVAKLTHHRDVKVRSSALSVVAKIDAPETQTLLLTGMENERPSVRLAAMEAAANHVRLFDRGGAELARAVAAQLNSDSWQGRADAAHALGGFGKYSDVAALTRAVGDPNAYVRERAVLALGRLAAARIALSQAVAALIAATTDELPLIRLAAVHGLSAAKDPKARAHLHQVAQNDPDLRVANAARTLLKKTKN